MSENSELQPNPQDPAPRRKSKPKFEVPAEAGQPAEAGWVYRDDAEATAEPPLAELPVPGPEVAEPITPEAKAAGVRSAHTSAPQPLITNAVVMAATGLGLMTRFAVTALNLFSTPVTAVRRRRK